MSSPLISVIVPIYNVEKYLNKCIESIVNQTYKNLEIILVDDGSPDGSPAICDKWAEKDSRIKVIHKKNGGVSTARNAGLDYASGDYIGFVDGDDYIDDDMYEALLGEIVTEKADIVSCGMVRESVNGYKEVWGDEEYRCIDREDLLKSVGTASGILPVHTGNKLYKRETVGNIRFNTSFRYAEDTLFNFEVALNCKKAVIHNAVRYHYTNNDASASHRTFDEARFDEHRAMDIIFTLSDEKIMPYCIAGDVYKSFRTIKEMCVSSNHTDRFNEIRKRIVSHRKEIFKSDIYSTATRLKTLLLWLFPDIYKLVIKLYGKHADKKFAKKTTE